MSSSDIDEQRVMEDDEGETEEYMEVREGKESKRAWFYTCGDCTESNLEAHKNLFMDLKMTNGSPAALYHCFNVEESGGKTKLKGYIYFRHQKTCGGVKKILPGCRIGFAKIDPSASKKLCLDGKDSGVDFFERGELPLSPQEKGVAGMKITADKYDNALQVISGRGKVSDISPDIYIPHYVQIEKMMKDYAPPPADLTHYNSYWYYGETNTGKTYTARNGHPNAYYKDPNTKWWCGFKPEKHEVVIIDGLNGTWPDLAYYLKMWSDKYSFAAEYQDGSRIEIRPKKLVVTSNCSLEQLFFDNQDELFRESVYRPLKRRFRSLKFTATYPSDDTVGRAVDAQGFAPSPYEEVDLLTSPRARIATATGEDVLNLSSSPRAPAVGTSAVASRTRGAPSTNKRVKGATSTTNKRSRRNPK